MENLQQELVTADTAGDEATKTEALIQLNQSTLGGLGKIMEDNPTVDLWPHLRKASRQYKVERENYFEEPKIESEDIVVKISKGNTVTDLANLHHIRNLSRSIPVPDALGMLDIGKTFYVFTTFVPGIPLDRLWQDLTFSKKKKIQQQLNTIFTKLRNLPLPSEAGFLGAGDPPLCKDMRHWIRKSSSIIRSEAEFNDFLLSEAHVSSQHVDLIRPCFRDDHRIFMTHSDLYPRNIIASNEYDLTIAGIIDWEAGGGYPEYWEYVKSLQSAFTDNQDHWHLFLPEVAIGTFIEKHIRDTMINRMVY